MSKLFKLLVYCAIILFSYGSDCPLHNETFLKHPGNSIVYTRLTNGTLTFQTISCAENTTFSATELKCVRLFELDVQCTRSGRILDRSSSNCSKYVKCTQLDDGSYVSNRVKCPSGTVFSPHVSRCVAVNNYNCTGLSQNFQSVGCLGNGRYSDPNAINCSSYLICTRVEDGSFSSIQVNCPPGTLFSSNVSRCISSTNYTCPTTQKEFEDGHGSGCQGNGRFPDPTSSNCTSYLACTQLEDGGYTSRKVICPSETVFSPNTNRCVSNSVYSCVINTNQTRDNLQSDQCHANGRFPDPSSVNCSSYMLCTQLENGSYTSKPVICPTAKIFSPIVSRCVSKLNYQCPGSEIETRKTPKEMECTGNGRVVNPNSYDCTSYLICTRTEDGRYTTNPAKCPVATVFSPHVYRCVASSDYKCNWCNSPGRFADPNSTDCSTYVSCTPDLVAENLNCPKHTLFSIEKLDCIIASDVACHAT